MQLALVFLGGGLGSVLRYLVGCWFRNNGSNLPVATFAANITACLIFALFVAISQHRYFSGSDLRLFILTGICGGLSTFSTFGYETYLLLHQGMIMWGILNIIVSVVLSLIIFQFIN
jgi:fluoride exporter